MPIIEYSIHEENPFTTINNIVNLGECRVNTIQNNRNLQSYKYYIEDQSRFAELQNLMLADTKIDVRMLNNDTNDTNRYIMLAIGSGAIVNEERFERYFTLITQCSTHILNNNN